MIGKLLAAPLRYKLTRPLHLRLAAADMRGGTRPKSDDAAHLAAAIDWLCRAQDVRGAHNDAGSVSAGWNFEDGWLPGYPETTGYIIETFIAAARYLTRSDLLARAHRMIDWELSLQHEDGAFPGHFGEPGSRPVIFNTGQIMHGMVAGYVQCGRNECLEAAVRAGHWLARHQEPEGFWRVFEHRDVIHVYNTRGTWALVATALLANDQLLLETARRNLDWAVSQQTPSGWYRNNAFTAGAHPYTHTIAYAVRGLLESGVLLGEQRYLHSAHLAATELAARQRQDGWLAGTYADGWTPMSTYSCVTGVAQMCLNWLRLAQETGEDNFRDNARRGIEYVKGTQRLDDPFDAARGGIPGSHPIWGAYSRFEYPNWAAKFFVDALMIQATNAAVPPVPARNAQKVAIHA